MRDVIDLRCHFKLEWGLVDSADAISNQEDVVHTAFGAWELDLELLVGVVDAHHVQFAGDSRVLLADQGSCELIWGRKSLGVSRFQSHSQYRG